MLKKLKSIWSTTMLSLVTLLLITGTYAYINPYVTHSEPVNKTSTNNTTTNQTKDVTNTDAEIKKPEKKEPVDIHLFLKIRLFKGDKVNLKVKKLSQAKKVEVTSSNKNVATISKDGKISAKHCGTSYLTMTLHYKNEIKNIKLKTVVSTSSYRNKKNLCFYPEENDFINAYSTTKNSTVTLKSTNDKVISIKDKKLTAIKPGKAKIIASSSLDNTKSTLIISVKVVKKPELKITEKTIDAWFNGSIIAGHSIGCGFQMYCNMQYDGYLGTARHLCKNCYGVYNDNAAITPSSLHLTVKGKKARLKDHVKRLHAKKVLINYGLNDIGAGGAPRFINAYETFLSELSRKNPKTTVYIISPTPIFDERGGLNNSNMRAINKALKKYAKKHKRVEFIDMYTPLIDSSGKLRADLCSDHYCHLTFAGYKIYGDTLREFAKNRLIEDTDKEDREKTKAEAKKYKISK